MEDLAPMLVAITLILTVGAVLLLRPVARRLGDLLELMAKQRSGELELPGDAHTERLLESIEARLSLMEERIDYTDQLLRAREEPRELPTPQKEDWE